jgi:hypothetical protein
MHAGAACAAVRSVDSAAIPKRFTVPSPSAEGGRPKRTTWTGAAAGAAAFIGANRYANGVY